MIRCLNILWLSILISLGACSSELDRSEYIAWVSDYENGLHVSQKNAEYTYDVQYKPAPFVLLQRDAEISPEALKKAETEGIQYFTLTVQLNKADVDFLNYGISTIEEKQQKIYYFSYQFQNNIRLEESGEQLPCILFHFERSADLKNSRTFVLAFESHDKLSKQATLVIDSPKLSTTPTRITISKDNIPSLKL